MVRRVLRVAGLSAVAVVLLPFAVKLLSVCVYSIDHGSKYEFIPFIYDDFLTGLLPESGTVFPPGFSRIAFASIVPGQSKDSVIEALGEPMRTYEQSDLWVTDYEDSNLRLISGTIGAGNRLVLAIVDEDGTVQDSDLVGRLYYTSVHTLPGRPQGGRSLRQVETLVYSRKKHTDDPNPTFNMYEVHIDPETDTVVRRIVFPMLD
jgi:hypothetical protein